MQARLETRDHIIGSSDRSYRSAPREFWDFTMKKHTGHRWLIVAAISLTLSAARVLFAQATFKSLANFNGTDGSAIEAGLDVERQNLSVRMYLRRFTRLTNGFSKKLKHLTAAVHLYMGFYNFVRVHQTIRVTPAMEAGLTDHVWSIEELLLA